MIIYGKQVSLYVLKKHPELIEEIYFPKEIDKKLFNAFSRYGKIIRVDNKKAQALSKGGNHQGFLMKVKDISFVPLDLKNKNFVLILYKITDIGNIGAIVRSAYIFGVDAVVVVGIKNLKFEHVARSSAGAVFDMPVSSYENPLDLLNELKMSNFTIYAATLNGYNVAKENFPLKKAIFLGSEGEGIPEKILKKADKKISINMVRDFDSLNVSAASAIICDRIANGK